MAAWRRRCGTTASRRRSRPGVEEPVRDRGILGPARHEAPAVAVERAFTLALAHAVEPAQGTDVPAGWPSGSMPAARAASRSLAKRAGGLKRATRPHMGLLPPLTIGALARVTENGYSYEHMFAFSPKRPTLSADLVATLRPVALAGSRMLPLGEPWNALVPKGGCAEARPLSCKHRRDWAGSAWR